MNRLINKLILTAIILLTPGAPLQAQVSPFTRADTLRGSDGPGRSWWEVTFYDLHVTIDPEKAEIEGWNRITYRVLAGAAEMQIDLQVPLEVDSIVQDGRAVEYRRDGNALFVQLRAGQAAGQIIQVTV